MTTRLEIIKTANAAYKAAFILPIENPNRLGLMTAALHMFDDAEPQVYEPKNPRRNWSN